MQFTEEQIDEAIEMMEEDKILRRLKKQLFALTLDKEKQENEEIAQQNDISETKNSEQNFYPQNENLVRTKRENFRQELRKTQQESQFKLKRVLTLNSPIDLLKEDEWIDQKEELKQGELKMKEIYEKLQEKQIDKPKKKQRRRK